MTDLVFGLIGIVGTISTIIFAYLAFKRNNNNDIKNSAKNEGALLSDVAYIKSSIDRMEFKFDKVEGNYQMVLERLIKVEKNYEQLYKKIIESEDSL